MNINLVEDAAAKAAPAGFQTAMQTAVNILDAALTNPITVNISVDYGVISGNALADGGPGQIFGYSYNQVVADAMKAAGTTPTAANATFLADLPPDPTNGGLIYLSNAQLKAWGLESATGTESDGSVQFSSQYNWDYTSTGAAGTYDLVGAAIHELTHALGRVIDNGAATFMNLVTYGPNHTLDLINSDPRYFSVNGKDDLANFDSASDPADFAAGSPIDPDNAYMNTGTVYQVGPKLSPIDSELMNVLGFSVPAATPPPPPTTITVLASASYDASNAIPGDTFVLDGANTSLVLGLSSSATRVYGDKDSVTVANGSATIEDHGRGTRYIVDPGANVTIFGAASAYEDLSWLISEPGTSAAALKSSAHASGGNMVLGTGGANVTLMYAADYVGAQHYA